jgi:hypothetical protein
MKNVIKIFGIGAAVLILLLNISPIINGEQIKEISSTFLQTSDQSTIDNIPIGTLFQQLNIDCNALPDSVRNLPLKNAAEIIKNNKDINIKETLNVLEFNSQEFTDILTNIQTRASESGMISAFDSGYVSGEVSTLGTLSGGHEIGLWSWIKKKAQDAWNWIKNNPGKFVTYITIALLLLLLGIFFGFLAIVLAGHLLPAIFTMIPI